MSIIEMVEKLYVGRTQCQKLIAIKVFEDYHKQVRKQTIEECAKVCEDIDSYDSYAISCTHDKCAKALRGLK